MSIKSRLISIIISLIAVGSLYSSAATTSSVSFGRTYNPNLSPIDSLSFKIYCSLSTFPLFWMDNDKCYTVEGQDNKVYIKDNNNKQTINNTTNILSSTSTEVDIANLKQDYNKLYDLLSN